MSNYIFCQQCDTYLPPEVTACPTCGQARPAAGPVSLAWAVALGQVPAGPPLALGSELLIPGHDLAQPPRRAALHWLNQADGQPARPPLALAEGVLWSGVVQTSKVSKTFEVSILVATSSADPLAMAGSLMALDVGGQEVWRWQAEAATVSAPVVVGERVWVTTSAGDLVGLELATGRVQAQGSLGVTPAKSAPLVVEEVAFIPTRGPQLLAWGLDGQERWRFRLDAGWLDQTPLKVGERLFAGVNLAGLIVALEQSSGRLVWPAELGSVVGKRLSRPATDGERLFVGAGNGLYAFDLADGRQVWHLPTPRRIEATPVVAEGVVYAAGHDRTLYALEAASGAVVWQVSAAAERLEQAPLILTEPPLVVVADRKGRVVALPLPLAPEQHEAAGRWLEAAIGYAGQGELARAAELLQQHGQPFKAAQLRQATGQLEPAAEQYEVAGRWLAAAELWGQLDRPNREAAAWERQAGQAQGEEERATAWEKAIVAFEAAGQNDQAERGRVELARLRHLPYLTISVEHGPLVWQSWSHIRFKVGNVGGGLARNLMIRAARDGQFEGQVTDTRQIVSLKPGQHRLDWLDLRPLAHGPSVPLRVTIEYLDSADRTASWQKSLYVPVAQTQREVTTMEPTYQLKNIRTLLREGFSAEELRRLCFENTAFRPVYDQLAGGSGKAEIIDRLLEYATQMLKMEELLALLQALNPARYARRQPYLADQAGAGPTPVGGRLSFKEIKRQGLQQRLEGLLADYQAANNQFNGALSEVERTRLKRQIATLEADIQRVEQELAELGAN